MLRSSRLIGGTSGDGAHFPGKIVSLNFRQDFQVLETLLNLNTHSKIEFCIADFKAGTLSPS